MDLVVEACRDFLIAEERAGIGTEIGIALRLERNGGIGMQPGADDIRFRHFDAVASRHECWIACQRQLDRLFQSQDCGDRFVLGQKFVGQKRQSNRRKDCEHSFLHDRLVALLNARTTWGQQAGHQVGARLVSTGRRTICSTRHTCHAGPQVLRTNPLSLNERRIRRCYC